MTGVTIKGLEAVPEFLSQILDKKRQEYFMDQLVNEMAMLIRQYAPRDSAANHEYYHPGQPHLEDAIEVQKIDKTRYRITIKVPYAKYLEWGTRYIDVGTIEAPKAVISGSGKMSFRPFVRPAIWQMFQHTRGLIESILFEK